MEAPLDIPPSSERRVGFRGEDPLQVVGIRPARGRGFDSNEQPTDVRWAYSRTERL